MVRRAERQSSQNQQKGFFSRFRRKPPVQPPAPQETPLGRNEEADTRVRLLASEDKLLPKSHQLFAGDKASLSFLRDADPKKQKKAFEALSKSPQERHDKFIKTVFENIAKDSKNSKFIKEAKSALDQLDAKEAKKVVGDAGKISLFERPNFLGQIKHASSEKLGEIQQELELNLANNNSLLDKEEAPTRERIELMLKILEAKERLEIVNIMSYKGIS